MTEKEWPAFRVANYLLQNIHDAMRECDVKASVKSCLMEIQEEGFISSFELIRKAATIQNVGHVESVEVQHAYHK